METFFIKIKHPSDAIEEIKRKAINQAEIELLVQKEFPEAEILDIKTLLLD
jgi:hypothetical protein